MKNIEFQEEIFQKNNRNFSSNTQAKSSKLATWLIEQGLVKDIAAANVVLTIFALIFFGISIYIFIFGFSLPQRQAPSSVEPPMFEGLEV